MTAVYIGCTSVSNWPAGNLLLNLLYFSELYKINRAFVTVQVCPSGVLNFHISLLSDFTTAGCKVPRYAQIIRYKYFK